jgi:hypothetical protein
MKYLQKTKGKKHKGKGNKHNQKQKGKKHELNETKLEQTRYFKRCKKYFIKKTSFLAKKGLQIFNSLRVFINYCR